MPDAPFAGRRVLVTGGSGFLGRHLIRRLVREGASVHAVSRAERDADASGARWWRVDLRDGGQIERLLGAARPEVVFHLAGHVTAAPELAHVLPTFTSLLASTVELLVAAQRAGDVRVVQVGSLVEPVGACAVPGSPYVAAKSAASAYARMFQALYHAPVVIAHLGYTYGPEQDGRRLIPQVIAALLRGEPPRLTSGSLCADWLFIDDAIDGLLAAARTSGCSVDLGSGTLVPARDVVLRLSTLVGAGVTPRFGALPDRPREQFRPAAVARTEELIGWRARTSLDEGLRRTLEWYRSTGHGNCQFDAGAACES